MGKSIHILGFIISILGMMAGIHDLFIFATSFALLNFVLFTINS